MMTSGLVRIPEPALLRVRVFAFLLLMAVWLGVSSAHARSLEDVQDTGVLSVAVYRDFPPYSWQEGSEDKGYVDRGIDVEIARELSRGLGVKLELHWMIPDENLDDDLRNHVWKGHYLARIEDGPMLKREVADVMLRVPYDREFAFKVDPDGRVINDLVHFFAPYQRERWELMVDNEQVESIENLALFMYDKVGVEIDSLPDFYLSSAFRGMLGKNVNHYTTPYEAIHAMQDRQVAGVMAMESQLLWGASQLDQPQRYRVPDVPFPNLTKRYWDVGMAVKDDHRGLAYALEDVITRMVTTGEMDRLFSRYHSAFHKPDHYLVQSE